MHSELRAFGTWALFGCLTMDVMRLNHEKSWQNVLEMLIIPVMCCIAALFVKKPAHESRLRYSLQILRMGFTRTVAFMAPIVGFRLLEQ